MIDVRKESLIQLSRAAKIINPAKPPSVCTVWRWAGRGVRGQRLESIVIGGVRHTSEQAVERFISRLNEPGSAPRTTNTKAIEAGKRLREKGA